MKICNFLTTAVTVCIDTEIKTPVLMHVKMPLPCTGSAYCMAHNRTIPHGATAVVLVALSMVVMAADAAPPTAASNLNGARYRIANMPQLGTNISLLARSGGL